MYNETNESNPRLSPTKLEINLAWELIEQIENGKLLTYQIIEARVNEILHLHQFQHAERKQFNIIIAPQGIPSTIATITKGETELKKRFKPLLEILNKSKKNNYSASKLPTVTIIS